MATGGGMPTNMRVICAWCQQEGRTGLLRVREPLEDSSETHGICDRHQQAVFETFPSTSFPTTRWLFIVPRGDISRFEHMTKLLRDVAGTTVILDRRRADRRRAPADGAPDRRRYDRRVRRPETNSLGYGLVRFKVDRGTSQVSSPPVADPAGERPGDPSIR
ncbi:MAG TPA: hypothetical protein VHZ49_21835 [Methylomirabilota bacterium]|jgi:hypothetical protein|nr:hypothetical protein [Methylomirabilota bacterium]